MGEILPNHLGWDDAMIADMVGMVIVFTLTHFGLACFRDRPRPDGEGRLVATADGWICPFCNYKQSWALAVPTQDYAAGNGFLDHLNAHQRPDQSNSS